MRLTRLLGITTIGALIALGFVVDRQPRPSHERPERFGSSLQLVTESANTWFCPGGSGSDGPAEVSLELTSVASDAVAVTVSVLPGGSGGDGEVVESLEIAAGAREVLELSSMVPLAPWVGAVVEIGGPGVLVEQVVTTPEGGVGRTLCLTSTADSWIVASGATRLAVEGERFVIMLLNPYPDAAVADIDLVGDVGRDAVEGVVVPARRVVAVDVSQAMTEAEKVTAFVDVVAGRLSVSWIQLIEGPTAGSGTRMSPAVQGSAVSWVLPIAGSALAGRRDVIAVTNPSADTTARVDLEFIADDPWLSLTPVEVDVSPERTALVDLTQQQRLVGAASYSVVARSINEVPIAVSISSVSPFEDVTIETPIVAGTTAMIGADSAARRWLVPVDVTDADVRAGWHDDSSAIVVFNPAEDGIALVDVAVSGELVRSIELGPTRRARLQLGEFGAGHFVVEVESSAPVVVGRELVGLTSRTASLAAPLQAPPPPAEYSNPG